jgi:hypothetical protein
MLDILSNSQGGMLNDYQDYLKKAALALLARTAGTNSLTERNQKFFNKARRAPYDNPSVPVPINEGGYSGDGYNNPQFNIDGIMSNDPTQIQQQGLDALKQLLLSQQVQFDPTQGKYSSQNPLTTDKRNQLSLLANRYITQQQQMRDNGTPGPYDYNPSLEATRADRMRNDPRPPPIPGSMIDQIGQLMAADKSGNAAKMLPMLMANGLLGGQQADPVAVKLGQDQFGNIVPAAILQGEGMLGGGFLTGDPKEDAAIMKTRMETQKLQREMNAPAAPQKLGQGEVLVGPDGKIIGRGDPKAPGYGAPFQGINAEGKPTMFILDDQGNKVDLGIAPILKKGMSFSTGPNGEITFEEGGDATGDGIPLGKAATNTVQDKMLGVGEARMRWNEAMKNYSSDYLTYGGKGYGWGLKQLDKTFKWQPDKEYLQGQTKFTQATEQLFNQYRKEITGAAAAVQELERLRQSILNTDQSPAQFEAASQQFGQFLDNLEYHYNNLMMQGFKPGTRQFGQALDAAVMGGGGAGSPGQPNSQNDPLGWN